MDEHSYACNYQTRNNMTEPTVTTLWHHNSYWTREVRLEWFGGSGTYERIAYLSLAKQVLDEMFSTGLGFQLKIHMVWMVDIPSAEEYDVIYPMAFAPMSISPMTLSRSGAAPYSIATLVREVRALARDKVEAAEVRVQKHYRGGKQTNLPLSANLFGLCQLLPTELGQLVNFFCFVRDFGRKLLLSLGKSLLRQFGSSVAVVNECL